MNVQSLNLFKAPTFKKNSSLNPKPSIEKLPNGQIVVTEYWADGKISKRTLYTSETLLKPLRFALHRDDGSERIVHDANPIVHIKNQEPVFKTSREKLPNGQIVVTEYWPNGKISKKTLYADETLKQPLERALYRTDGKQRIVQKLLEKTSEIDYLDQSVIKTIKNDDGTLTTVEYWDDGITPRKEIKYSEGKIPTILEKTFYRQDGTIEERQKYGLDGGFIEKKYYPPKKNVFGTYI